MVKNIENNWPEVQPLSNYFMGIDPGGSGGICIIKEDGGIFELFKTPDTPAAFLSRLNRYRGMNVRCLTEQVYCRPTDGVKAAFGFGHTVGILHAVLASAVIEYQEIRPQVWQKHYVTTGTKQDRKAHKNNLKERAIALFPDQKVTLWSADALLLAHHCFHLFNLKNADDQGPPVEPLSRGD